MEYELFLTNLNREIESFTTQLGDEILDLYKSFYEMFLPFVNNKNNATPEVIEKLTATKAQYILQYQKKANEIQTRILEFCSSVHSRIDSHLQQQFDDLRKKMLVEPKHQSIAIPVLTYQEPTMRHPLLDPSFNSNVKRYRESINQRFIEIGKGLDSNLSYLSLLIEDIKGCVQIWDKNKIIEEIEEIEDNFKKFMSMVNFFNISNEQIMKDYTTFFGLIQEKYCQLLRQYSLFLLHDVLEKLNVNSKEDFLDEFNVVIEWRYERNLSTEDFVELKLIIIEIFNIRSQLAAQNIKGFSPNNFANLATRINKIQSISKSYLSIIQSTLLDSLQIYETMSNTYKNYFKQVYMLYQGLVIDFKKQIKDGPNLDVYMQLEKLNSYSKFGLDVINKCEQSLQALFISVDEASLGLEKGDFENLFGGLTSMKTIFNIIIENQKKIEKDEYDALQIIEDSLNDRGIMPDAKIYNQILTDLQQINIDAHIMIFR